MRSVIADGRLFARMVRGHEPGAAMGGDGGTSPRRVCVDLEECIVSGPLEDAQAILRNLQLVRDLKDRGDVIIVHTTAPAAEAHRVQSLLSSLDVPFDEVAYGKPAADVHVLGRVYHPSIDAESLLLGAADLAEGDLEVAAAARFGFVPSRSFNTVKCREDGTVVKSSAANPIRGELFFYSHMPLDVAHLFPALLQLAPSAPNDPPTSNVSTCSGSDDGPVEDAALADSCAVFLERTRGRLVSICMSRVDGPTFSHLLTARCLTPGRLERLLASLRDLHTSDGERRPCSCTVGDVNIYDNYRRKVERRYRQHVSSTYAEVGHILTPGHVAELLGLLHQYESEDRGVRANVVHGDAVLCNVVSERDGGLKFIDMRGMQGEAQMTLAGDATYDLAKCWQSLSGYDYIVRGRAVEARDADICSSLQATFRRHVATYYPTILFRDIVLIAASLYASLIPLHDSAAHRVQFARRATALLQCVTTSRTRGEADLPWGVNLMGDSTASGDGRRL